MDVLSNMHFKFSARITIICGLLALLMFRASWWQSERHVLKVEEIALMTTRLERAPESILTVSENPHTDWKQLIHRRLSVSCQYDYEHEMILRNRRYEEKPGAFVITPCRIKGSKNAVLVNRGFVSYAFMDFENRKKLNRPPEAQFLGLVKESMKRKPFSPSDPEAGGGRPWVDAWLRVSIKEMEQQIPYPLLPIYLEIIPEDAPLIVDERLVQSKSGRDDLFYLNASSEGKVTARETVLDPRYPIPVFDTIIPPGRHKGYIYEWAAMGLLTLSIGLILQMRRAITLAK
jgi:cytochrome oxidase assembly protein ShyY1